MANYVYNEKTIVGGGSYFEVGSVDPDCRYNKRIDDIPDEAQAQALVSHLNGGPNPQVLERIATALESIARNLDAASGRPVLD